jgi:hypothetical protein
MTAEMTLNGDFFYFIGGRHNCFTWAWLNLLAEHP